MIAGMDSAPGRLSHLNASGEVHMVEVGDRPATDRRAVAEGFLSMEASVLALVLEGRAPKGDVLAVARVAAIQGAKRTWELIPLCHPIALTGMVVGIAPSADPILAARASAYAESFRRRARETLTGATP